MNPSQIVIQWEKTTGKLIISPQNMTDAEVLVILKKAIEITDNHILEAAKKSILIASGPLPSS